MQECLNHNWSLTIPHLNLTSSDKLLAEIRANLKDTASQGHDTYVWHTEKHSIMFIWNIILSLLVSYLMFHRPTAMMQGLMLPPVMGQMPQDKKLEHDAVFYITWAVFTVFLLYLISRLIAKYWEKYKNSPTTNHNSPPGRTFILEIPEVASLENMSANAPIQCKLSETQQQSTTKMTPHCHGTTNEQPECNINKKHRPAK
ncbi:unnamed protein product [Ceutorhynchus assimilis]|uniref:Uncharacterized protein n=1 Tax=Ceutorhynchus assimilis TaxID=467358 RepID=A0A9P0DJI2_9CUCU|nr:unnamed protein product [Ceutorhynchus assimilis]